MIDGPVFRRSVHADPQASVFRGPDVVLNITKTVVASMRSPRPKSQLAERKVDVVADHQQVFHRNLIEVERLPDRSTTQIHERFRLQQQDLLITLMPLGQATLEAILKAADAGSLGQRIKDREADIVPGADVLPARVAKTNDQFHRLHRLAATRQRSAATALR